MHNLLGDLALEGRFLRGKARERDTREREIGGMDKAGVYL